MVDGRSAQWPTRPTRDCEFALAWLAPALLALLTIGAAAWVTRRVQAGVQLHGLLVGLVAAFIGLVSWRWPDRDHSNSGYC